MNDEIILTHKFFISFEGVEGTEKYVYTTILELTYSELNYSCIEEKIKTVYENICCVYIKDIKLLW